MTISSVTGNVDCNITLTDLLPYTSYALCVQASTVAGPGNISSLVTDRTYPEPSSPPTNFAISSFNSTSVALTWGYPMTPRGLIQGYVLMKNITISTFDTSVLSFTCLNLMPYTDYVFSVRAYCYHPVLDTVLYGEYTNLSIRTAQGCK